MYRYVLGVTGFDWAANSSAGSHLGGVHFELTGDGVTECIGGPSNLSESNLEENYTSYCDPRLNYGQSMAKSPNAAKKKAPFVKKMETMKNKSAAAKKKQSRPRRKQSFIIRRRSPS
eukprot:320370_1